MLPSGRPPREIHLRSTHSSADRRRSFNQRVMEWDGVDGSVNLAGYYCNWYMRVATAAFRVFVTKRESDKIRNVAQCAVSYSYNGQG